jgi:hypothetical protein
MVLMLAACTSPTVRPASPAPSLRSSSASAVGVAAGYVGFGQPLGAPIPDLIKDGFSHVTKLSPRTSTLAGPAYGLILAETAATTTITGAQQVAIGLVRDTGSPPAAMTAAPGTEFVVVQIGPPLDFAVTGHSGDVAWSVTAGTQTESMPSDFRTVAGQFPEDSSIVVCVPVGADAVLSATDDGKAQAISLRTGTVVGSGGNSTAALRSGHVDFSTVLRLDGAGIDIPAAGGLPHNGFVAMLRVDASLALNAQGHPAAKPGRAWLVFQAYIDGSTADLGGASTFSIETRLRPSLTIRAGGTAITVPADTVGSGAYVASGPITWIVDVPRTLTSVDIGYLFNGVIAAWSDVSTSTAVGYHLVSGRSQSAVLRLGS